MTRTYDATHDQWLIDANVTVRQGTEHDGTLRPCDMPDMRKGNPVQHRSHLTIEQGRQLSRMAEIQRNIKGGSAGVWDNGIDYLPNSKRRATS